MVLKNLYQESGMEYYKFCGRYRVAHTPSERNESMLVVVKLTIVEIVSITDLFP